MKAAQRLPRVIWQIIDVNVNRAMEGLRAAEEFVRFGLRDAQLTRRCRRLRQAIGRTAGDLPGGIAARFAARDVRRDVGRQTPARCSRAWTELLSNNLQRVKESLRVLEECARAAALSRARHFQRLRFDAYALETAIHRRVAALRHPRRRSAARAGRGLRRARGH